MKLVQRIAAMLMLPTLISFAPGPGLVAERVSKPGAYSGYSAAVYDGTRLSSQYVTMRDGNKIALDLYRPTLKGTVATQKLPVIWANVPYNRRSAGMAASAAELTKYGYIVAVADMRGNYASFGIAVEEQGATSIGNRNQWLPWAYWDAYDLTEWLAAQPWSDSKIGMMGCSALGHTQWQAAATMPPHLKAIFPMSAPSEYYDWGGITAMLDTAPSAPGPIGTIPEQDAKAIPVDEDIDATLLQAAKESHRGDLRTGYIPFRDSVAAGLRAGGLDNFKYHLEVNTFSHLAQINESGIPAYQTANFGEDQRAKLGVMVKLRNIRNPMKLVLAPGNHCNWTTNDKAHPDNSFNITVEQLRWNDYWLKNIKNGIMDEPPIYLFTYNTPPDKAWQFAWQWPLPTARSVDYYFGPSSNDGSSAGVNNGSLGTSAPTGASAVDRYTVDYSVTAATHNQKGLTYTTPALSADTTMTGHPVIHLWVSSAASDGDFLAYLYDVAPDGTATRLKGTDEGQLRASHRALNTAPYDNLGLPYHRSFAEDVKPLTPGVPVELVFDMAPMSYVFKAGHRIRLVLSNVAIPRHKSAPAPTPLLSPAPVVSIHREVAHASRISMPVNQPITATVRLAPGKATLTAYTTFPSTLDSRYIRDVKLNSVTLNGIEAGSTRLEGDTLVSRFDASKLKPGTAVIQGAFGNRYNYGDLMTFTAPGVVTQ